MTHLDVPKRAKSSKFHAAVATGYAAFEPKPSNFTALLPPLPGTGTVLASSRIAFNEWSLLCLGLILSRALAPAPPRCQVRRPHRWVQQGACNETETTSHGHWGCLCGNLLSTAGARAQEAGIEEVVVTGSYCAGQRYRSR